MRLWPVTVLVTGCFATPTRPSGDGSSGYRRTITIAQPPAEPLQAFPLSVLLEDDASLRDNAGDATHVAFLLGDDTALPCEIVRLTSTGTLEAWVLLPDVPTSPVTFDLAYGADVVSTCERSSVWADYRGVWHLNETLAGSANDSSSFAHTLSPLDGDVPVPMPGMVGNGLRFDPTDVDGADQLCIENAPGLQLDSQPFSYELWVNQEQYLGSYDAALRKGGASAGNAGFDLELGQNDWAAFVRDAVDPANRVELSSNSATLVNSWHHLAVTIDRSAGFVRGYRDGVLSESEALMIDSVSGTAPLCLGSRSQPMIGWLDEVRVHSVARTAAWFAMAYNNIAARSELMTIGDEH